MFTQEHHDLIPYIRSLLYGVLEVHGIDRFTSVRRNNQTLGSADFQYNATTRVMTIPLSGGATSVQIRR